MRVHFETLVNWSVETYTSLVAGDKKVLETSNMHLVLGKTKNGSDIISIMGKYTIEDCPGCISIMLM